MAEIIKFPGKKRDDPPQKVENQEKRKNDPKINFMIRFLTDLIKTDPRSYDEENIIERQIGLKEFENDELGVMLNESGPPMWQEKPSFYHALIREMRKRKMFGSTDT